MAKIFIVEDDENIRDLVLYTLQTQDFETKGFENPSDFYRAIEKESCDLVLLDIMLPEESGISVLKNIRSNAKTERLPVILLTAKNSEYDKVKGLDLGADDYITKPFSVLELLSRIKALLRRSDNSIKSKSLFVGQIMLDPSKHIVTVNEEVVELTHKEFELLQLLLENKGRVYTRETLLSKIWGIDFDAQTRTVDVHVKTLRQKLLDQGDIIKTIRGVGYKVDDNL